MIVSEPANVLAAWFRAKSGIAIDKNASVLATINADHKILSALAFHNWHGVDIEISVVPRPVPRSLLRAAYRYVVGQLGCSRVTFKFRADNTKSINAAQRLGGKLEGRIRRFYPDGCDQLIFGILKEDYPHGK